MGTQFMLSLSAAVIPALVFYIIATGLIAKRDIYRCFTRGAAKGIRTVAEIAPTLTGLMVAVGVLRASGLLEFTGELLSGAVGDFPQELVSLFLVKTVSSSAATGLALDIFKEYGTDSYAGLTASLALSSTETIFYTMSVYGVAAGITKMRWTLAGALFATATGIGMSIWLAGLMQQ